MESWNPCDIKAKGEEERGKEHRERAVGRGRNENKEPQWHTLFTHQKHCKGGNKMDIY